MWSISRIRGWLLRGVRGWQFRAQYCARFRSVWRKHTCVDGCIVPSTHLFYSVQSMFVQHRYQPIRWCTLAAWYASNTSCTPSRRSHVNVGIYFVRVDTYFWTKCWHLFLGVASHDGLGVARWVCTYLSTSSKIIVWTMLTRTFL